MIRLYAFAALALWGAVTDADAGAWTLSRGEFWGKLTYFRHSTEEWYLGKGRFGTPGARVRYDFDGRYESSAAFIEGFYGLSDRLDLGVQIPYFDQSFANSTFAEPRGDTGLSDIRVYGKLRLIDQPLIFTLKTGAKMPTGEFKNEDGLIPVGEGQWDFDFVAQFGRSFWPLLLYANIDLGYRVRTHNAEIDRDRYIGTLEMCRNLALIIRRDPLTAICNGDTSNRYRQTLLKESRPGFTHRHDDPAPISVFPRNGSLHERRIGNGEGGFSCFCIGRRPAYIDRYELAGAFAIAHYLGCKISEQFLEYAAESLEFGRGCRLGAAVCCPAGRRQQNGVAGRSITVNGNAVKRSANSLFEQCPQHGCGQLRIGKYECQHRRHIRRNHARSFGNATKTDFGITNPRAPHRPLRISVGRTNRSGGVNPGSSPTTGLHS